MERMITAKMVKELREISGAGILDCKKALNETDGDMDKAIDWLREKGISKAAKKANRIAAEGLCSAEIDGNFAAVVEVNSETDFVAKNEKFQNLVSKVNETILSNKPKNMEEALSINMEKETLQDLIISSSARIGEKIEFRRFELVEKSDNQTFAHYSHMGGNIVSLVVGEGSQEVLRDVAMHIAASTPRYLTKDDVDSEVVEKEESVLLEAAKNDDSLKNKPENILKNIIKGRINKWLKEICLLDQPFVKDSDKTIRQYLKENNASIKSFVRYMVGEGIEKRKEDFAKEVYSQVSK